MDKKDSTILMWFSILTVITVAILINLGLLIIAEYFKADAFQATMWAISAIFTLILCLNIGVVLYPNKMEMTTDNNFVLYVIIIYLGVITSYFLSFTNMIWIFIPLWIIIFWILREISIWYNN